jgi:hypothetical protein
VVSFTPQPLAQKGISDMKENVQIFDLKTHTKGTEMDGKTITNLKVN